MSKSADRAAELNRIIVEQGMLTRSMKYGYQPTEQVKVESEARAERAIELIELLNLAPFPHGASVHQGLTKRQTAEHYLNERIASWLRANPLPLTMQRVHDILAERPLYPLKVGGGVYVSIGDLSNGGYQYRFMADDFAWSGARVVGMCTHDPKHEYSDADCDDQVVQGDMVLRVPESVAEHFRQQGRRKLQREIAGLLAVKSER